MNSLSDPRKERPEEFSEGVIFHGECTGKMSGENCVGWVS